MKKIVCELCEGTVFVKDGNFFICQGCGTKYSLDEAKALMHEVDDNELSQSITPVVNAVVPNPSQQQIDNLLVLATTAYEAQNNQEAENYCNRAIELDATNYKAWLLKGKAVGWSSSLDNNRMQEAAHSFSKAIDFAPPDETEEIKSQAVEELKRFGAACMQIACDGFGSLGDPKSYYPGRKELNKIRNARKAFLDSIAVLSANGNEVSIPEDYTAKIADQMVSAANCGFGAATANSGLYDLALMWGQAAANQTKAQFHEQFECCYELMQDSINLYNSNDEDNLWRYDILIDIAEKLVNDRDTSNYTKQQYRDKIDEAKRKKEALEIRVKELKAEAERKAEEEKQARIKAYWEAHADEKKTLEAEKEQLSKKKEELDKEIDRLTAEIESLREEEKTKVPSEEETARLMEQIHGLEVRRAKLGLFSGKEKKQIDGERASLQGRIDSIKNKIDDEKKEKASEIRKKLDPAQKKKDELLTERDAAVKRISVIEEEFTKDPA